MIDGEAGAAQVRFRRHFARQRNTGERVYAAMI